jgi:hypothetical protein
MKVRGNQRPARFWLEVDGNTATAYFTENVREIDESGEDKPGFVGWEYDRYKIERPYDDGLRARIEEDIPIWVAFVKFHEMVELSEAVKKERNARLAASDWTALRDSPVTGEKRVEWEEYRNALRDTDSKHIDTYPYGVVFPEPPTGD